MPQLTVKELIELLNQGEPRIYQDMYGDVIINFATQSPNEIVG